MSWKNVRSFRVWAVPLAAFERDGLKAALRKAGLPCEDGAIGPLFCSIPTTSRPAPGWVHGPDALLPLVTLPPRRAGVGRHRDGDQQEAQLHGCDDLSAHQEPDYCAGRTCGLKSRRRAGGGTPQPISFADLLQRQPCQMIASLSMIFPAGFHPDRQGRLRDHALQPVHCRIT